MTSRTGRGRAPIPPGLDTRIKLEPGDVVVGCCTDTRDMFTRVLETAMREQGLEVPDFQQLEHMVVNINLNVDDDRAHRVVSVRGNVLYVEDLLPLQPRSGEYVGSLRAVSCRRELGSNAEAVAEAEQLFGAARTALTADPSARITRRK